MAEGYDWSKWTQTSGGSTVSTTNAYSFTMGTSDIAYTANATAKNYTINYTLNGGTLLPSGYTPVEYITSNGTNYFNTSIYFDFAKDFKVVGKFSNPKSTVRKIIIGNYSGSGVYNLELKADGKFRTYFNGGTVVDVASSAAMPANTMVSYESSYNASAHTASANANGSTINASIPASTAKATNPLRFFLDYRSSPSAISYPLSIGETFIYKDNDLVGHFVPARNAQNVCGMYDTVSETFFASATSTAFTCPETSVLPTSYTYGVGATITGAPTRNGYEFAGWCTDNALTTCNTTQTISTTATGIKTYYAKWFKNLTYNPDNGGTTTVATCQADQSFVLPATPAPKTGYTFAGWTVNK